MQAVVCIGLPKVWKSFFNRGFGIESCFGMNRAGYPLECTKLRRTSWKPAVLKLVLRRAVPPDGGDVAKASSTGVTVSPKGRWLLYPQIDQHVEDLMMVEGFR